MIQDFNFHTHTFRCGHAEKNYTDEDYVKEAIEAGMKYLCFTDHMPYTSTMHSPENQRMNYNDRKEYLESINRLKYKYKDQIKIESGFEVEYLPGEEKYLKELKQATNILILGQHCTVFNGKVKDIKTEMTDKELFDYANLIAKALELNIPDIIAHPDFFMRFRKEFGEKEEKVSHIICEAAAKYNVPVEINLGKIHNRLKNVEEKYPDLPYQEALKEAIKIIGYPCREFWKIAAKYNLKAVYGGDIHFKGQILKMNEYIKIANNVIGKEILKELKFINENLKII